MRALQSQQRPSACNAEAFISWDIIARALFVDNGAAAGLAKFNSQVHDVAKAAPGGTRAFSMMERGLQSLAFEAAGVSGPLGQVAAGLLRFGGGAGLVLGAAAGIGLVAEAYNLATAEAKNLTAAHEKLAASYDKILSRGKSQVQAMADARDAVAAARDEFNKLSATVPSPHGPVTRGSPGEVAQAQENLNMALRQQGQVRLEAVRAQDESVAAATREANALEATNAIRERAIATGRDERDVVLAITRVTAERAAVEAHLDATHAAAFVAQQLRIANAKEETKALEGMRDVLREIDQIGADVARFMASPQGMATLQGIRVPTFEQIQGQERARQVDLAGTKQIADQIGVRLIGVGMGRTAGDIGRQGPKEKPDYALIAASSVALMGALRQGGAAGILGAAGGVASQLGNIKSLAGTFGPIGIGLNIASGIFGLFNNEEDRRHKEMMAELRKISARPNLEPRAPTNVFVGAGRSPAETAYIVGRRYDRDAVNRMGEEG